MRPAPFTIADVADLLSIQRLKGGDENAFNVECPFCGDMRGKCNFSVIKNGEEMCIRDSCTLTGGLWKQISVI